MYLHHLPVWDPLDHEQIDNIEREGTSGFRGNVCRVEFYTSASKCWTIPGFHRSCHSMTAVQGVSLLFQVGCKSFLVFLARRIPCPYIVTSFLVQSCTGFRSKRQTWFRHLLTFQNHLQLCPSQCAYSALVSEDLILSSPAALFLQFDFPILVAPWPFFLFCFVA